MPYGLLYFYESGTNDDKTTYADVNETILNSQPLVLGGDGSVPNCFYSGSAKVVLITNAGTQFLPIDGEQQWERDPVTSASVGAIGRTWDAVSIYDADSVVVHDNIFYVSIINNNQNNNPSSTPTAWTQFDLLKRFNINETYQLADPVIGSDGFLYTSLIINNTGNDPTSTSGFWTLPNLLTASGALVRRTVSQSIPSGSNTEIAFDAESYDDNGYHDNAVDNTRLTVPTGITRVRLTGNINFDANSTGNRRLEILKNGGGATGGGVVRLDAVSTGGTLLNVVSAPLKVIAGDYFELQVFQNSGAPLDVVFDNTATWFAIEALE